jgi:hypothetical protein
LNVDSSFRFEGLGDLEDADLFDAVGRCGRLRQHLEEGGLINN